MPEEEIVSLGKGALPDPYDPRDYTAEINFGAAEPINWSKPLSQPEPVDFNKRSSLSCVGCGSRNLHWAIKPKDFSRRDIYSRIFLPQGGAYLRDGVKVLCDVGNQTQDECPDPKSPTEALMRQKSALPDSAGADDKEMGYFVIKNNTIDAVAQAIRDFKGASIGVTGSDAGWKDKTNPRPPKPGEPTWGHCIYAFGYHMHGGVKCIIAKSSWCSSSHKVHHIKEEYFASGNTFNGWCLIPKEDASMTNSRLVKTQVGTRPDGSPIYEYGFWDPDTAPDALISDMRNRGITPPLYPDGHPQAGKLDWDRVENMVSGVIIPNK